MITDRVDNITRIPDEYRDVAPPCPKSVKIELTARCDLKCFFCATGFKLREREDMDFDFLCRLLVDLRKSGVEEIGMFYLGESFLYKNLPEAIALAREIGFHYIFLTTNGRMATSERVAACMAAGLDSLKFSFNWSDGAQCKEITGIDCFDRVVNNIREARRVRDEVEAETGHHCGVFASSIRYDDAQHARMQRAVDLIRPHVDTHYWLPLYNQAGFTSGVRGTTPVAGNVGRLDNMRDPLPCWAVFTEGHVTYDGHLAACCFDHDGRFHMGDLKSTPFMEAWHSAPFQELRAANLSKDVTGTACEKCIAYS